MANLVYPRWKQAVIQGGANSSLAGTVKVMLVDSADYTYSGVHEFLSDVPVGGRVGTSAALSGKTFVDGTFDAADISIAGVTGDSVEQLILFIDTGVEGTSRLVCFMDTGVSGLPLTPANTTVDITWNASGIFSI
jgi:hypothetical protein